MVRQSLLFIGLLLWSLPSTALEIITTLRPIGYITAAITSGVSEPKVLLPAGVSAHHYALRPSDLRALDSADLVIWVGPELERFLEKPLADHTNLLTLLQQPQLPLRHFTSGGHHHDEGGAHKEDGSHENEEAMDGANVDPHLWLGPDMAIFSAEAIAKRLSELDPNNQASYQANLAQFKAAIAQLDKAIAPEMRRVSQLGYLVYHDAYGYWERYYSMRSQGYFTESTEQTPGAKRLSEIEAQIKQGTVRCLFAEPQFAPTQVAQMAERTGTQLLHLDESGGDLPMTPDSYLNWMRQLSNSFAACH